MNKGSQKSTAINHIDKTLDDYIKKAKGQTKAQPGQPKSGKVNSPKSDFNPRNIFESNQI
jgi:hypothetical protein